MTRVTRENRKGCTQNLVSFFHDTHTIQRRRSFVLLRFINFLLNSIQSTKLDTVKRYKFCTLCCFTTFMDFVVLDSDKGNEAEHSCLEESTSIFEGVEIQEPYVGMEFDSEVAARKFYVDYARRVGFVVRIMQRRRSGIDGRTLARRLGCNKQGFSPNNKGALGPEKKPRPSAREGCKATILVKLEKSGKWVVTRFIKDHNHPLIATANGLSTAGDKDEKISELTLELERQDQLCAAYREKLLSFINNIEEETEELSTKIQLIFENVRRAESETKKCSQNRKPWCLT